MSYFFVAEVYSRHQQRIQTKEIWAAVEKLCAAERQVHEFETVLFLHDCFRRALGKSLQLSSEEMKGQRITKKWKDYELYRALIPRLQQHKINPLAFFTFGIEQRQRKGIPPRISNIATDNAIQHYCNWVRSNQYRVTTYANHPDYESQLYSQLDQDISSLVTLLIRKPYTSLGGTDLFMLSRFSKVLVAMSRQVEIELTTDEKVFADDLMFIATFATKVKGKWNQTIDLHISRVQSLAHELRQQYFNEKVVDIVAILRALRLS